MKDKYSKELEPFYKVMETAALCCAFSFASSAFIWDTDLAHSATAGWGGGAFAQVMGFLSIAFGTIIAFGLLMLIAALAWGVLLAPLRNSWHSKDWPDFFGYFFAIFFIFNAFTYAIGPRGFDLSNVVMASLLIVIISALAGFLLGTVFGAVFAKTCNTLGVKKK